MHGLEIGNAEAGIMVALHCQAIAARGNSGCGRTWRIPKAQGGLGKPDAPQYLFADLLPFFRFSFTCAPPAREKMVGWYHTGPKLRSSDLEINELIKRFMPRPVMVIVDPRQRDVGIPTDAYFAVEEIKDVSVCQ